MVPALLADTVPRGHLSAATVLLGSSASEAPPRRSALANVARASSATPLLCNVNLALLGSSNRKIAKGRAISVLSASTSLYKARRRAYSARKEPFNPHPEKKLAPSANLVHTQHSRARRNAKLALLASIRQPRVHLVLPGAGSAQAASSVLPKGLQHAPTVRPARFRRGSEANTVPTVPLELSKFAMVLLNVRNARQANSRRRQTRTPDARLVLRTVISPASASTGLKIRPVRRNAGHTLRIVLQVNGMYGVNAARLAVAVNKSALDHPFMRHGAEAFHAS